MGILDFDDKQIMKRFMPTDRPKHERRKFDSNFEALQQMGRKENSADFEDSPFADRKPIEEKDHD